MTIRTRIESAITEVTGERARFKISQQAHGGSISNSQIITLDDSRRVFVKTNLQAAEYSGMFAMEHKALQLLAKADVIKVPETIAYSTDFIVMHAFSEGEKNSNWSENIGRQLAQLHLSTKNIRFGFEGDNYIGTTLQINEWSDTWLTFWREQRLAYQLALLAKILDNNDKLLRLGEKIMEGLDVLLGNIDEGAVLLHGDLWSGNASANEKGEPVIYDPASYYGHREAEMGMMRMFGGFGPHSESAYNEVWPLQDGAEQRILLYRLYHELNHLILFGNSYYENCISTMKKIA